MSRLLDAVALALALCAHPLQAGSVWPQFRGPGAAGVSEDPGLPDAWSATENVVWKAPIPGRGWSSPIVWGRRIFLTTAISEGTEEQPRKGLYLGGDRPTPSSHRHRWKVYCIDWKSGKLAWEREAHVGRPTSSRHIKNSHASETPCTDGQRVYAYFGNVGLFAYDLDGRLLWSRRWGNFRTRAGWGSAASPAVHKGRVYIVNDNEQGSFIEALDAETGKTVWHVKRREKSNWSTPFIWENERRTEIVTPGSGRVRSYGLDGKLLWELRGMSSITIPTPFAGHGVVYVSSGFVASRRRPIYAIRPGASGDISLQQGQTSNAHIAWCQGLAAPYNPSPLLYRGQIYVLHDRGFMTSYDARTGKPVYGRQRIGRRARAFTASPWAYDGKVFCLSEDGDTFVIQAGREFNVVRKNSLGDMCMATPAIANGSLILRTASALYRIQKHGSERGSNTTRAP